MNKKTFEWKWTHGPIYEKSSRRQNRQNQQIQHEQINQNDNVNQSQLAYQQSFISENDVWSMEEQQVFIKEEPSFSSFNKRENTYHKMAEREMVGQIGANPFTNTSYLEDVIVQDNFLKPANTTHTPL